MVQHKVIDDGKVNEILRISDREKMLEEFVLYAVRNGCNKVDEIVTMISNKDNTINIDEILDTIKRLDNKSIILYNSNVRSFMHYISNVYLGFTFWITLLITSITLITVYILPNITPWNMARIIAGGAFMLFMPGYALIQLLFPKKDMDNIERIALSIGLSLAIVSLIGLLLNYSPWGIRLDPIIVSISIVSITLALASVYVRYMINKVNVMEG